MSHPDNQQTTPTTPENKQNGRHREQCLGPAPKSNAIQPNRPTPQSINMMIDKAALYFLERIDPYVLASYYHTKKKFKKALRLADQVVAKGPKKDIPWAQNLIGLMHLKGQIGFERSLTEATRWFRKAAAGSVIVAQINLGRLLGKHQDIENRKSGMKWLRLAARKGDPQTYFEIA